MKRAVWVLAFISLWAGAAFGQQPPEDGEHKTYYSTGELKSSAIYSDGKKHGIEQFFDKDGKVLREYYYQRGVRQGEVVPEPERNFGTMRFVQHAPFWIVLSAGAVALWFIISKLLLKKRPF